MFNFFKVNFSLLTSDLLFRFSVVMATNSDPFDSQPGDVEVRYSNEFLPLYVHDNNTMRLALFLC